MAGATSFGTNPTEKTRSFRIGSMQNDSILFSAGAILHSISHILVLTACIILVIKHRTLPLILMLVAQILVIVFSMGSVVWMALSAEHGTESLMRATKINAILGPLPYILFGVGMLWHAIQTKKESKQMASTH